MESRRGISGQFSRAVLRHIDRPGRVGGGACGDAARKALGLARDTAIDLLLVCAPCALVGARLYYVAFSWDAYRDNLWKIFSVREGGMAIYGSVIFGVLAALAFARARKIPFFALGGSGRAVAGAGPGGGALGELFQPGRPTAWP